MNNTVIPSVEHWLQFEDLPEVGTYKINFQVHHLGNVFIRSLHGGVTGATMEMAAEKVTRGEITDDADLMIVSSSIDYLRITKDSDLFAKADILRRSKRLCVVDVMCWQDDPDVPVAHGIITLKIS